MALSDSRRQRVCMLCGMYFAQGVPWGFMTIALIAYLAELGVSDSEAGVLTAMVLVPWTFKLVWAPLIDTMTIRSMGRRRPWIIGAQFMMAVSLLGLLMMGDLSENLRLLGWMFFLHNCFASLQDVSTDALAVDILPHNEQGRTNGMMWGSKLVGKSVGAFVMAIAIARWGLSSAVMIQFVGLLIIMLLPILMLERPGEKRLPWSKGQANKLAGGSGVRSPAAVAKDLYRAFGMITTSVFFVYGVIHVIGWGIVEVITKVLYVQQLAWEAVDVSKVAGSAVFFELFGALLGGFLADRFGRRKVMTIGFGTYGLLHLVFAACPGLWGQTWFTTGYLLLNPGALAMGAVGFLSMGMRLSWTTAAATVFTIYMTVSNIGHVIGNSLFVWLLRKQLQLSYEATFFAAGIVTILPLLLLLLVRPEQVDRMKSLELDAADKGD